MKTIAENARPSSESLDIVRRATADILEHIPDDLREPVVEYAKWHTERLAFDIEHCRAYAPGRRILECGCFPLIGTRALTLAGFDHLEGADILADRYTDTSRKLNLKIRQCNFEVERLPFEDEFFDMVLLNEVFEHLRIDLIFTFSELRRVLRPGGILTISTPNLRSAGGIYNFLFRHKAYSCDSEIFEAYETLSKNGHMGHVREYTPHEVSAFVEHLQFRPTMIMYRGRYDGKRFGPISRALSSLRPFFSLYCERA